MDNANPSHVIKEEGVETICLSTRVIIIITLSIQLVILSTVLAQNIPIMNNIRQIVGVAYLLIIPGFLILRILRINVSFIEYLLYSIGVSLAFIMALSYLLNEISVQFGVSSPLNGSLWMSVTFISTSALCAYLYYRDNQTINSDFIIKIKICEILSPKFLSLLLLPFVAIFGAIFSPSSGLNYTLVIMISIISIIIFLFGINRGYNDKYYAIAILSIALALVLHKTLITNYLIGWDIQNEYYISNLVLKNEGWDSTIPFITNGMLSITFIAPMFSSFCGISLMWVYKLIYPLIFTFVPLCLYLVFNRIFGSRVAFFSSVFFISYFVFYGEMLSLARQEIAEFFLALILLVLVDRGSKDIKKTILALTFGLSLIVSHYGLTYVILALLIVAFIIIRFAELLNQRIKIFDSQKDSDEQILSRDFILILIIASFTWYIAVSSGTIAEAVIGISNNISRNIISDFFNPKSAQGLAIITSATQSFSSTILKDLHIVSQMLIGLGILMALSKKFHVRRDYLAVSLSAFFLCLSSIVVPFFASSLNTTRLYQITLIFLAPFCIYGFLSLFKFVSRNRGNNEKKAYMLIGICLSIFLLSNSGVIHEIMGDNTISISLDRGDDSLSFCDGEVVAAKWQLDHNRTDIYSDHNRWVLLSGLEWGNIHELSNDGIVKYESLIYLGEYNINHEMLLVSQTKTAMTTLSYQDSDEWTVDNGCVYHSKSASIYLWAN